MSGRLHCAALVVLLCGCGAVASLTRPEGDGGWNQARRSEELERAALAGGGPGPLPGPAGERAGDAAAGPPSTAAAQERLLSLRTALEMAQRHNRTIAIAAQAVDVAAGDVGVARSPLLPKTTVQSAYTWYDDALSNSVELSPDLLPPDTPPPVVTVREQEYGTLSAAMKLALDVSGELRHGLRAAQASYRAEKARAWATTLSEQRAVVQAYLGLLQAERLRDVAAQTVELYERQLADADSQFRQGRLTRNGVLVVQVALSNARQRKLRAGVETDRRRREVNKAVGLPIAATTEIEEVPGRPTLPDVEEAAAEARRNSPVLGALLEEEQAVQEKKTALERARFPRLSAGAGYDTSTAKVMQPRSYASAVVGLQWDLGSDLARESEIGKLGHAAERTRVILDRSARELEEMVRTAHDAVRERLAAADASVVALGQAEEYLRIRQEQFDAGRATSEDVLDATVMLARERARVATARYQAYARRAELQQLMGRPLADLVVAASPPTQNLQDQRPPK